MYIGSLSVKVQFNLTLGPLAKIKLYFKTKTHFCGYEDIYKYVLVSHWFWSIKCYSMLFCLCFCSAVASLYKLHSNILCLKSLNKFPSNPNHFGGRSWLVYEGGENLSSLPATLLPGLNSEITSANTVVIWCVEKDSMGPLFSLSLSLSFCGGSTNETDFPLTLSQWSHTG